MTRLAFLSRTATSQAISQPELAIETAKLNVYSGSEAIETLKRFPNVDAIVADTGAEDITLRRLVRSFKAIRPTVLVISISSPLSYESELADDQLKSFEPVRLRELLKTLTKS